MIRTSFALAAFIGVAAAGPVEAASLENLERERALLIATMLDPALDAEHRAGEVEAARRRLVDLEAITLRDPGVREDRRPIARRAFEDYDLTFIGHASLERGMAPVDLWMQRLGLSSARVLSARVGRR
jgi:hypothetical protein